VSSILKQILPEKTVSDITTENAVGCTELARVDHFHIDLYENYIPGLCAGLSIKREDLDKPLDYGEYPIISCLFSEGIGGLVSYVSNEYNYEVQKPTYASKCELCYEIRRYLVVDKGVESKELQPYGHYLN